MARRYRVQIQDSHRMLIFDYYLSINVTEWAFLVCGRIFHINKTGASNRTRAWEISAKTCSARRRLRIRAAALFKGIGFSTRRNECKLIFKPLVDVSFRQVVEIEFAGRKFRQLLWFQRRNDQPVRDIRRRTDRRLTGQTRTSEPRY